MKTIIQISYISVFVLMIGFIGASTMVDYGKIEKGAFMTIEHREPASLPEWSWQKEPIKRFFKQLDSYINDAFSFRQELTGFYATTLYRIGVSASPNKIIIGKNGFLFLGNGFDRVIDQMTGKTLFNEQSLRSWSQSFNVRKKYLDLQGIPFYAAIVPKKHSLYREYLPDDIILSDNDNFKQIRKSNPDFDILYLLDTLMAAKPYWGDLLYNKTDSHWSEIGAYVGYARIINYLKADFPQLDLLRLDKEDFIVSPHPGGQNKIILSVTIPVDEFNVDIVRTNRWDTSILKTNYAGDTLPFDCWSDVSYHEKAVVYNSSKPYTLLILEDSFSIRLSKYLHQSFGKVIYCHYNDKEAEELTELVEKYKPDLVLYEFGEQSVFRHTILHSNLIMKQLQNGYKPILKMDGNYLFEKVKQQYHLDNITLTGDDFCFESTGNDPILILPEIILSNEKCYILRIDFTVPKQTISQIFYLTDNANFDGDHCVTLQADAGRNALLFYIPEKGVKGNTVRFDPGGDTGEYCIHSIEILEEK